MQDDSQRTGIESRCENVFYFLFLPNVIHLDGLYIKHIVQYKQVDYKITVFFSIVMVCGFATSRAQYQYWLGTPCATIRIIRKRTYFRFMGLVSYLGGFSHPEYVTRKAKSDNYPMWGNILPKSVCNKCCISL